MNPNPLDSLARDVRETQDGLRAAAGDAPAESDIRGLVQHARRTVTARRRRRAAAVGGLGIALVALALVVGWPRTDALHFTIGETAQVGDLDHWLRAAGDVPLPLRFSDGTVVTLQPGARGRVVRLDRRGARVLLETGRASASVVPRPSADWAVTAGPFTVQVVGTEFDVDWDPGSEALMVLVSEGRVRVTGPVIGSRDLDAGQRLEVHARDQRVVIVNANRRADGATVDLPAAPAADTAEPDRAASSVAPSPAGAPSAESVGWQNLAREGKPKEAFAAVEAAGFDSVTQGLGAEGLLQLADVARAAGKARRATSILHLIRERHPGSRAAAMAAYTLGTTAFDQRGSYSAAIRWFSTYLGEAPGGGLAREALGRLMEAQQQSGQTEAARGSARQYLKAYPKGPHRDVAKRILGKRK